jgi:crotonobetaine/carnitine-CoA ligase
VISRFREHDYSLTDFLAARIERQPDAVALEFEGQSWTYRAVGECTEQLATWLAGKGVREGDRVAVMSANHPTMVMLLFGLARLGAILVPINPEFGVNEARFILNHTEACGVIAAPGKLAVVRKAIEGLALQPWLALNESAGADANATDVEVARLSGLSPTLGTTNASSGKPFLIVYTSGSTGLPKGAVHGQRGYVLTAEMFVERMWLQPDERVLCVMPLFHINALMYSLGGALACGGTLILAPRFSASTFWRTAAATGATEVNLLVAAGTILTQRPRSEFVPGHRLAKMFIAPQTRSLADALRNEFGVPLLIECYGMTEIPGAVSNPFAGPRKLGTMGILSRHPNPRIERPRARIIDDEGRDVAPGATGELLVRTPTIMLGYFRDPKQTAEAFHEGWFKTGDMVYQGEDGYYRFVARRKDIIRRRGENIASAEIELVFSEHPDITDVAVIGVPSPLGEEDILAAIVARAGVKLDAEHLAVWVGERLAAMKVPRYIVFVDGIPTTATHKPAKLRLKEDPTLLQRAVDLQSSSSSRADKSSR